MAQSKRNIKKAGNKVIVDNSIAEFRSGMTNLIVQNTNTKVKSQKDPMVVLNASQLMQVTDMVCGLLSETYEKGREDGIHSWLREGK